MYSLVELTGALCGMGHASWKIFSQQEFSNEVKVWNWFSYFDAGEEINFGRWLCWMGQG